jgi:hypothetical protein
MTSEEQKKMFEYFTSKQREVLISKGHDYADKDVLSNFKLSGSICQLSPEKNCLSLIATKVARLGILLNSNENPKHESIDDSILDLANYTFLLKCLLNDK